jgi:hypothetical protein
MKLFAISDLHVGFSENAAALRDMPSCPNDWLILAGDIGETARHLDDVFATLVPRFRQVIWCPGNHELWTIGQHGLTGLAKYESLLALCRRWSVLTPEDDYAVFTSERERFLIVPMFLLYDYTFRPDDIPAERAVAWAGESGVMCADEELLDPRPFASRADWCRARCQATEQRIEKARRNTGLRTVLINHFPLKQVFASPPAIPRFQIWCGTRVTEDWHVRFDAAVVVTGHLHMRQTRYMDGTRFEEVSLGYPRRQWSLERGIAHYLREILPDKSAPGSTGSQPARFGSRYPQV